MTSTSTMNPLSSASHWFMNSSWYVKAGIIIVVLGGVWFGYSKIKGSQTAQPTYQTDTVTRGTLVSSVSASGNITSGNNLTISTNATGVVKAVYVKNGDHVTQGQKIADLTLDQDSKQRQTAAYASYLSAKNQLASAQAKLNSLQAAEFQANQKFINDAVERDLATTDPTYIQENASWLQAEADYKNQSAIITQAQTSVTSAWYTYQQLSPTITSPLAGTVSNLTIAPGVTIVEQSSSSSNSNNTGTPQQVGAIVPPDGHIQAIVNLSEIDAAVVKPGQKVSMTMDAFADKSFTGKVLVIDTNGAVSSGVTTYPTTIVFDNSVDNMYPNMAVSAQIITNVKDNVLIVPTAAIQTANGQSTVRVMKNDQVTSIPVETGISNDTQIEIVSGLSEGDTVVTGSSARTSTTSSGGTSVFSSLGGNRGFGGGGRGAVQVITR